MNELERNYEWTAQTPDPVVAMRALVPALHGNARWYQRTGGYALSSQSTRIRNSKNLESSSRRVPDSIRRVSLKYATPFSIVLTILRRPDCSFLLDIDRGYSYTKDPDTPVNVSLQMEGPNTDSMAGLMDRVKIEIESELARQNAEGWHATPLPEQYPDGIVRRVGYHPWFVGIVGSIVASVLWLALVAGWSLLRDEPQKPTTVSTTTSAPAPPSNLHP